jgi:hypothetical protein
VGICCWPVRSHYRGIHHIPGRYFTRSSFHFQDSVYCGYPDSCDRSFTEANQKLEMMPNHKPKVKTLSDEACYKTWQRLVSYKDFLTYYPVFVLLFPLMLFSYPQQFSKIQTYILLAIGFVIFSTYIFIFFSTFSILLIKNRRTSITRGASKYLVTLGINELSNGDEIRVSFILSRLFFTLYDYIGQMQYKLGRFTFKQREMMGFDITSTKRKHLLEYIQNHYDQDELRTVLNQILYELNTTSPAEYKSSQSYVISTFKGLETFSHAKKGVELDNVGKTFGLFIQIILAIVAVIGIFKK